MLTDVQLERYSRQILLPEVGGRGQERLFAATVTLAGAGDAVAVAAALLARAGIGHLVLVDGPGALPEGSPECRVERAGSAANLGDVVVDGGGDPVRARALGTRAQEAGRPFVAAREPRRHATVVTLLGRPCVACLPEPPGAPGADEPRGDAPPELVGAILAIEVLRLLLRPGGPGRRVLLDVATGEIESAPLAPTAACPRCGGTT
jgi:adenylyltransferase/sulfurtransferase